MSEPAGVFNPHAQRPWNWRRFLLAAIEGFEVDWHPATSRAVPWETCPCSDLDFRLLGRSGIPHDDQLRQAGLMFCTAILERKAYEALNLLNAMREREIDLLRAMNKEDA